MQLDFVTANFGEFHLLRTWENKSKRKRKAEAATRIHPQTLSLDLKAAGFARRRSRYGRLPQAGLEPSVTFDLPPPPNLIV